MPKLNFFSLRSLYLLLGLLLAGRLQAQILLPVEVLGPQGTTKEVSLQVGNPNQVAAVYMRVHRPGFRAASTDPTVRASVRINGSSWVDLTNANCESWPLEASYGGIGGGFMTVRFKIAASKFNSVFVAGTNTLSIRLNQTDGHSSGVRVLDLNLLDASGAKLLPASAFAYDDPKTWTAPRTSAADVAEGERLWKEAVLKESPLTTAPIRATCSGCHHVRGLDLKYFNYSNHAIIERTKFHGLSQQQGEQIASYIRGLVLKKRDGATYDAPGTAWAPVYQPGPGLDAKPVELWSAGAGLDAVLEKDSDMIPYLFPGGTSVAAMKAVTSSKATLNLRELPIALQMPDWNEWCSPKHPVDIWGDNFYNSNAWKGYQSVRQELANGRNSVSKERLRDLMQYFTDDAITQTLNRDGYRQSIPAGISEEDAVVGMRRWAITKIWELNQDFQLDDMAPQIYPNGERGWLGRARSVFELAPHLSGKNGEQFAYQTHKVGKYFSTAWYHLQVIVNAGYRDNHQHHPVDWKYHLSHIENLSNWFTETPGEGLRFAASMIKDMQMWDNSYGVKTGDRGWNLLEIWPETLADEHFNKLFRDLSPELRRNLTEAFYSSWYEKSSSHPIADYERWNLNPDGTAQNFSSYKRPPANFPYPVTTPLKDYAEYPNRVRNMILMGRKLGVNGALLNNIADFGEAMWPLWDFDQLKGETSTLRTPENPANAVAGLDYGYYHGTWSELPNFAALTAVKTGTVTNFDLSPRTQNDNFGFQYTGYVDVPTDGEYTFYTSSDDGSKLSIGSTVVVDNDGLHGSQEKSGTIGLKKGKHALTVTFFERGGGEELSVSYAGPGISKQRLPATALFRVGTAGGATNGSAALVQLEFNENGGTAVANTGSAGGNLQRTAGTPTWSANVPVNGGAAALDFGLSASNYAVESSGVLTALGGLSGFTITGWVNNRSSSEGGGGNRVVSWINNGGDGVDLVYRADGSLQLGINQWPDGSPAQSNAGLVTTDAGAAATNWRFFAVSYSAASGQVKFYSGTSAADATLMKTVSYSRGNVGTAIGKLAIGHFNDATRANAADRMFRGLIDRISIFGSELTAPQVVSVQERTTGNLRPASTATTSAQPTAAPVLAVYPNPMPDGVAVCQYTLTQPQPVGWTLYNRQGRAVQVSDYRLQASGTHKLPLDFSQQPGGTYFLHLTIGKQTTREQIILKKP